MKNRFSLGPATLVTAAFIGPGTVTACTLAGVNFGNALLWALLFSTVATMVLQEMAARLGIVGRLGLGEALRAAVKTPVGRGLMVALVVSAIFIGNGAYEGGNISGAVLGLDTVFPDMPAGNIVWPLLIGAAALGILARARYRVLERVLIGLVVTMSLAFIATFILIRPDLGEMISGLFIPSLPDGSVLTVIALIGTTVVPYNLFLHSAVARERFKGAEDLAASRADIGISISLGGLISIAIVSTAAASFFGTGIAIESAGDMAVQLEPLLGKWSVVFMGIGLLAAGISSAITAPLAAAYAATGVLGWEVDLKARRFKIIWALILAAGVAVSVSGLRPISIIWFAQVANGFLLPVMAVFLLKVMNDRNILGNLVNTRRQNLMGMIVVVVTLLLSGRSLLSAFGFI